MKKYLFNIAKIFSILYIAFITMFAFDEPVFSLGFIMHLIPTFILIACLIVAWIKPRIGGILFLILGMVFIIFFETYKELINFSLISLPLLIIGILYLVSKKK